MTASAASFPTTFLWFLHRGDCLAMISPSAEGAAQVVIGLLTSFRYCGGNFSTTVVDATAFPWATLNEPDAVRPLAFPSVSTVGTHSSMNP